MVNRIFIFLSLWFFVQTSYAVVFEATVDRNQVAQGESLLLTVRYNNNSLTGNPDFSPLKQQFDIIDQKRKSSFQFMNGKSESWTIWNIALIPKRLGNLVIPSLHYKGEASKPIQVMVKKLSKDLQSKQQDVFFDTQVDLKTAYVQGQILYTEKLYFSVALDNSQLTEVQVDEALVQALGETKNYRTQINGRSFEVYERQFVIFPQVSGEMIIPGPRYTGEIDNGRWRAGKPIRVTHPPLKVTVLPKPALYPQGTWLPAKALSLDYKWSADPQSLTTGEPVTLQLDLMAQGLSQAQLPAITLPKVKGLKYYPDQATTQDHSHNQGITGQRSQSIAIVPTQAGSITLPEIRLPWWNIKLGRVEYAVIPAQRLTAFNGQQIQKPTQTIEQPTMQPVLPVPEQTTSPATQTDSLMWQTISLVLFILAFIFFYLWLKLKLQNQHIGHEASSTQQTAGSASNPSNLKAIKKACRQNDPKQARLAILSWAKTQNLASTSSNISLSRLAKQVDDQSLCYALQELDNTLYSPIPNDAWQGEYLWQLIKSLSFSAATTKEALKPLYPEPEQPPEHKQA